VDTHRRSCLPQTAATTARFALRGRQRRILSPFAALEPPRATRHTPKSLPPTYIPEQTQIIANSDRGLT
jgi:hypothetical protein